MNGDMTMKKTMIMSFLIISMIISLCACGNGASNAVDDAGNMVENVGKDAADAVEDVGEGAKDTVEDITGTKGSSQNNSAQSGSSSASNTGSSSGYISREDAKAKAFEHAQVKSSDATTESVKLNTTDSNAVYDVEFSAGGYEYNYKVDAKTGEIVKSEKDFDSAK